MPKIVKFCLKPNQTFRLTRCKVIYFLKNYLIRPSLCASFLFSSALVNAKTPSNDVIPRINTNSNNQKNYSNKSRQKDATLYANERIESGVFLLMSFLDYIRQRQKSSNITFELVYHTPKRARGNVGPFGISNMTYDVDVILRDKSTNLANTVTFRSIINNDNKSIMENVFVNGNELKNKDIFDNRADDLRLKTKEELRTHMLYKTKTLISEIYNNQALAFTSLEKFKAQTRRRAVSAFHTGVKSTLLLSTLAAVLTVFVGGFTAGGLEVIYLSKNGFIDLNQANQANLETLKFGYYFLSFVNMAIIGTAMEQMNKWMKNRLNRVYNNHIVENKSERLRKERSLYMRLSDIAMNALNTRYFSIPNLEGITQNVLNRNFNLEDYLRRYKAGDVLVKNFSTGETKRVQFGAPVAQRVVPSGGQCKLLFAN